MSNFYGIVRGAAETEATRRGHKEIETIAASWDGAIRTRVYAQAGKAYTTVDLLEWPSGNFVRNLYHGKVETDGVPQDRPDIR